MRSRNPETGKSGLTLAGILLFGNDQLILSAVPHHRTDLILLKVNLELLEASLIEMTIPEKPRSSKQKYRSTDTGRQVLTKIRAADEMIDVSTRSGRAVVCQQSVRSKYFEICFRISSLIFRSCASFSSCLPVSFSGSGKGQFSRFWMPG